MVLQMFPVDLQLAPFPPPPVQITDLITGGLTIIGPPFRIDPFVNGLPLPTVYRQAVHSL